MAANTLARFDTNFGAFTVELYDSIAPLTVANFLGYVNSGLYNNTFFHRLVAGFVLQGGGYSDMTGTVATVPQNPPVVNEYQASDPDVAGTIAMAKLGGDPNSATDQFFFNLVDNTTTLGPSNNGGFTVFGRVVQGWNIVQTIAALPIVNAGSAFGQLPVVNYTSGQPITPSNLVQLQDVVVSGFGITAKLTDLGGVTSKDIVFENAAATARIQYLAGASTVEGFQFGNTIDLLGTTGATLSGNTVSTATGSLTLSSAPAGYAYKLYGDANGGTDILLSPTTPPAGAIAVSDPSTNSSETGTGDDYTGPVDYLQRQYIYTGSDNVAIRANLPNAFLKGGPGQDALQAQGGNNVLDGGPGSNFLVGGGGDDGGRDTFFVDARDPNTVTWSTIVHFHQGDQATIFGFHPGISTRPLTASDGVGDFTGVTVHSEINGAGTGVQASMTFANIDQATAEQHFVFTTGTLPGNIDYLLIQYT
jgi:cyclophilin family peptidyl-prolyl cis-trans isomerase